MTSPTPPARKTLTLSKPTQSQNKPGLRAKLSTGPRSSKPAGPSAPRSQTAIRQADSPQKAKPAVRANTVRFDGAPPPAQERSRGPAATRAATSAPQVQPRAPEGIRLNKYLADKQWCSRREADHWIERGWVTINGKPVEMGQRVMAGDQVAVAPAAHDHQSQRSTIVLHKPVGYVSGQAEDGHEPALVLLTDRNHWSHDALIQRQAPRSLKGFAPAGRLDIDSTGVLILTQDGRMARHIIGENSDVEKEYLVRVSYAAPNGRTIENNVEAAFPIEKLQLLCHGLSLDGVALRPAQVQWQNPEQLRFVLREGKKRQIRRMCEQVGLYVTALKRVRIGQLVLGNLPVGQWRYLSDHESV
ncbi:rRNA pseudouridine synthase [Lampropedia puyangensis]|uniref:Dual-specificity RNA pseudouridine synthase RluF n=1 Tax=Lampropedia puyangensis TaxID=1330072 RepID=A0A4S8ERD3_9BURK|nr:pseudouridine synthase [Lampropedia puyangensis]THT96064.1 rRNA pseudouridine synthase [Lampropedia puyangensis]